MREALAGLIELPVDVLVAIGSYFDPTHLVHSPIRFGWSGSSVKIWCCDTSTSCASGSGTLLAAAARACAAGDQPTSSRMPTPWRSAGRVALPQGGVQRRRSEMACGS